MAGNLHPTVVTDVNGRVTTVHKRADGAQGARKPLNAPAPKIAADKPAKVISQTVLKLPLALERHEVDAFDQRHAKTMTKPGYDDQARFVFLHQISRQSQAIVRQVYEGGAVPQDVVTRLLTSYSLNRRDAFLSYPDRIAKAQGHLQAGLVLAERIAREHPEIVDPEPITFANVINRCTMGYAYRAKVSDRHHFTTIDTEEEMASLTGVTVFIMNCFARDFGYSSSYIRSDVFPDSSGGTEQGLYIANRSLDAFLRENPDEATRAANYAMERGMGNTLKDTKAIIQFLAETDEMGALGEGWL